MTLIPKNAMVNQYVQQLYSEMDTIFLQVGL